jgi:hypothetical protein
MVQCVYMLDNGEQCSKEATGESDLCSQHLKVYSKSFIDIDVSFPVEHFTLLHITTFYGLQSILDQGEIRSFEKFKKVFLSFVFPTDKLKPFSGCKNKFVSILLDPSFFEDCSTERVSKDKYGTCHFTPFWTTGEKQPQSYKYKWNKEKYSLKDNLNNIFDLQKAYNFSSYGLEQENELVVDGKIPLNKYIQGIFIPDDFDPEYEDDFDLQEFKDKYPKYYFIDPKLEADKKRYSRFIDFKSYKNYTEAGNNEDEYDPEEN